MTPSSSPPEISLEVLNGPHDGLRFVGDKPEVHLGRAARGRADRPANDIVLSRDSYSSSSHARVFWDDGRWFVDDVGSTNFTKIRGETLKKDTPPVALEPHDYFVVGNSVVEFSTQPRRVPVVGPGDRPTDSPAVEKLVERARAVALKSKHPFVSVEHLFAAVATSESPLMGDFFAGAKLTPQAVAKQALELDRWTGPMAWIGQGVLNVISVSPNASAKDLFETPRLHIILGLAEKLRVQTGAPGLEAIHVMAAILQEGGSPAAEALRHAGQDCEKLAMMAVRLATAHYSPKEEEAPAGGTMQIAPPKPKHKKRKPVDHNAWLAARELTDRLQEVQVKFQLADPRERFEALRNAIRDGLGQHPSGRREAICEQLRLLFPIAGDTGKFELPPIAPSTPRESEESEGNGAEAKRRDDERITPAGRDAGDTGSLLKDIFDTKNLGQTLGLESDPGNNDFLRLTKYFYEFTLDMEHLIQGVMQMLAGGGATESRYFLPHATKDLKMMIQRLMRDKDPKVVEEVSDYLSDLANWMIALLTAIQRAANEWNQQIWDRISPAAIREASKASPSMIKMGMSNAELWRTFEKKVRDLHPEVTGDQFHQLVNALTTREFERLSRKQTQSD